MESASKVLACVDQSPYANVVVDCAAWAARQLNAPLELLHVIDRDAEIASSEDHSGALGFDTQEQLLIDLSEQDQVRHKVVREQGRIFLNELRERLDGDALPKVDVRQRMGTLEEAVVDQQKDVRLFVMGRRGESAQDTQRDIGRNVEHLVRMLNQPILTVTPQYVTPQRVLIAFDGSQMTRRGVAMIASSPLFKGLPLHVLMAGRSTRDGDRQLEWARLRLHEAGFDVQTHRVNGEPEIEIAKAVRDLGADLLAMGAYSHSHWKSFLFGSKTTDLLRSAPITTLLLR